MAAFTATGLALLGALPQLHRLVRTGDTNGVSLANATLAVGSELGWLAYTAHGSLWSAVPESALMAAAHTVLAILLLRAGVPATRPFIAAAVWSAVLVATTAFGGWALLGAVLPLAYAVQVTPAVVAVYRARCPSGVAVATWAIVLVECALWGAYGLAKGDHALMLLAVVGCGSSLAIVARIAAVRYRLPAYQALPMVIDTSWAPTAAGR
jgi:uncharacterized protein with PQ loop repeat